MYTAAESSVSKQFIDAVKHFLDEATDRELEVLASRLQPYTIDGHSSNSSTNHPVLILNDIGFS